jgi:hypothetical protein
MTSFEGSERVTSKINEGTVSATLEYFLQVNEKLQNVS